jgi:hypothetical protein
VSGADFVRLCYWYLVPSPLVPSPREPGATWSPRRHIAGLPALVDEHDLGAWLAWAPAGEVVAYHKGGSLAADRERDEALDLLARAVLARTSSQTLGVTAPPCGHLRALWLGSGELEAKQRWDVDGRWLYLAVRR